MVTAEEWHVSFTRKDGGSEGEDGKGVHLLLYHHCALRAAQVTRQHMPLVARDS